MSRFLYIIRRIIIRLTCSESDDINTLGPELCGFGNAYYFSNTFKKQTSLSPLQFRNSSKL